MRCAVIPRSTVLLLCGALAVTGCTEGEESKPAEKDPLAPYPAIMSRPEPGAEDEE